MIGTLLDRRYRIIKILGSGAFGQTYLAADIRRPGLPKCVVKQLSPVKGGVESLQTAKRLFEQEAETLESLGSHDCVPRLLAYFEEDDRLYLAKEYVDGHPLTDEIVPGQPLPEDAVAQLLKDVLSILKFVHDNEVIHRDVKPENLIRRNSDNELVLIDFGSVKALTQQIANDDSLRTIAAGTPVYMPIEQFQGNPQYNSDIYALGAIAVQSLTGVSANNLPKLQDESGAIIWRKRTQVSDDLADLIDKMVAYSAAQRYQSAQEVLDDLEPILQSYAEEEIDDEPDSSDAESEDAETAPPTRSLKRWLGATAVLIVGALGLVWAWQRPSESRAQEFYRRGVEKIESGDSSGAISEFDRAIANNPDNTEAYYRRGNVRFDLGEYEGAIADYTAAIDRDPDNLDAYYNRGLARIDAGQLEAATEDFSNVLRLDATDADAYYQRGLVSYKLGDYSSAIDDYTQAILLSPTSPYPYLNRGLAHSSAGNKQAAMADFTQAIRVDPENTDAYYSRGRARFALGDYEGAQTDYTQVLAFDPQHAEALVNRCSVQLNLFDYEAAVDDCTTAIELAGDDWVAYNNRCVAHYNLGEHQKAIADCTRTIELNPNHAKAYSNRGLAKGAIGDRTGAIEDYTQAIQLNPNNPVAYSNRGSVYAELEQYAEAIEDQTQAIRLNEDFASAYFNRASVREKLADRQGAIADYQRAAQSCLDRGLVDCYNAAQTEIQRLNGDASQPL